MAGWFELNKNSKGQFHFVLKAGNGEVVLSSEQYEAKSSATNGMASVRANSTMAERFEKKTAKNGKFFFNLKAGNHQVIGSSQMYAAEESRDKGVASVKANGGTEKVKDNT